MKDLFVPYELAAKLRQKGFKEQCCAYFNTDPQLKEPAFNFVAPFKHEWCLPAPLYQQVNDWLITKNYYAHVSDFPLYNNRYGYRYGRGNNLDGFSIHLTPSTRYEALNKAIEEVLKIMP